MQKIMISLYVLTASLALVVLKLGSKAGAPAQLVGDRLHINLTPYTVVGIALYGLSFVLYTYLISRYELSYIIPITAAFVYILIFSAAYFIFHEAFTTWKILGIVCIVVGLILLNLKK